MCVLACDSDAFMGNTLADLAHFLDMLTAAHVQNWLHIWKPFIHSSVKIVASKDLSLQGVRTMMSNFTHLLLTLLLFDPYLISHIRQLGPCSAPAILLVWIHLVILCH